MESSKATVVSQSFMFLTETQGLWNPVLFSKGGLVKPQLPQSYTPEELAYHSWAVAPKESPKRNQNPRLGLCRVVCPKFTWPTPYGCLHSPGLLWFKKKKLKRSNSQSTCKKKMPWESLQVQQIEFIPLELQITDQSQGDFKIHMLKLWGGSRKG